MTRKALFSLLTVCLLGCLLPGAYAEEEMELTFAQNDPSLTRAVPDEADLDGMELLKKQSAAMIASLGRRDWEALAEEVTLTGDWRSDLVHMAESQVGYQAAHSGATRYARATGLDGAEEWSAVFVSWAAKQIGLSDGDFPRSATFDGLAGMMDGLQAVKPITRYSYPTYGDLALIRAGSRRRVGIVALVSEGYAAVIHGDDHGKVTRVTYRVGGPEFPEYVDLNVLMERAGLDVGKAIAVPVLPAGGVAAWTNTNAVYLREEPTTASKRLTTVKKEGTAVLVTDAARQGDGYVWYGVVYGELAGYIRGDLLKLDRAALPASPDDGAPEEATVTPPWQVTLIANGDGTYTVCIAQEPVGAVDARGYLSYGPSGCPQRVIAWVDFAAGEVYPLDRLPANGPVG